MLRIPVQIEIVALLLVLCCLSSCSDKDDWYSDSRALKNEKNMYLEQLEAQGVDPDTARGAWNAEVSVRKTQGGFRDDVER